MKTYSHEPPKSYVEQSCFRVWYGIEEDHGEDVDKEFIGKPVDRERAVPKDLEF